MNDINMLFISEISNPLPMTCTMDGLKEYHNTQSPLPQEINLDYFELIEFQIYEANTISVNI